MDSGVVLLGGVLWKVYVLTLHRVCGALQLLNICSHNRDSSKLSPPAGRS